MNFGKRAKVALPSGKNWMVKLEKIFWFENEKKESIKLSYLQGARSFR